MKKLIAILILCSVSAFAADKQAIIVKSDGNGTITVREGRTNKITAPRGTSQRSMSTQAQAWSNKNNTNKAQKKKTYSPNTFITSKK